MDPANVYRLTKTFIVDLLSMGEEIDPCSVLRPENVLINEEKISLKNPMPTEAFVPVAGFAAPEQYTHGDCERAPVYFIGALMMTLLSGSPPPDARVRSTEGTVYKGREDPALTEVINRCLEYDPKKRYASLSFVLEALQKADGSDESEQLAEGLESGAYSGSLKQKKNRGRRVLVAVLIVLILAGGVLGYTLVQGMRADTAFEKADYDAVTRILDRTPWLKSSRQNTYDYATAVQFWQAGNYDGALEILGGLGSYADSEALAKQVKYDKGMALLQVRRVDEGRIVFEELGTYEDSAAQAERAAAYLRAEVMTDPLERYEAFSAFGEYLDARSLAQTAAQEVYDVAMRAYEAGDISGSNSLFTALGNFQDAPIYKQVCDLWLGASEEAGENRALLPQIMAYGEVANLEPVLMSDRFFMVFLEGDWSSADGGGEMQIGEDEFSAPLLPTAGRRWAFRNQSIGNESGTVATFGYLSPNEVSMTVAETGASFTYQRAEAPTNVEPDGEEPARARG
ncbi:hypothetical protein LJC49_02985 [Ruminococcaceae bacterium OttesenSCG-928-I18]|nr:hypothetical protein [Ruminococcaceae bacterium OttesenSCG-928-I18]